MRKSVKHMYQTKHHYSTGEYQIPAITLDFVLKALVINKEKWRHKNWKEKVQPMHPICLWCDGIIYQELSVL